MKYITIGPAGDTEMKIYDVCLHGVDNLVILWVAIQFQIRKICPMDILDLDAVFTTVNF